MIDKRLEQLAKILVRHSLEIKKNDLFVIYGNPNAAPLINEVFKQALKLGANPYTQITINGLSEIYYKNVSKEQLEYISPISKYEIKKIDVKLSIISPYNTRNMTNVDPNKQVIRSIAYKPIHDLFLKRASKKDLRWCVTQYPTNASAQDADMSLIDYENFIFQAAHVFEENPINYWKKIYKKQENIKNFLKTKEKLQVIAGDTDLTLSIKDREWINCYGKENFPDGEIFTGPVENSAEGVISYSFPAVHGGRLADNIKLWFKKGRVIKSKASQGESFLKSMLNMDKGSSRIGEFAFGTNYGIKKYTKNTLFDEKIGGTIHIAIGSGYPETGSKNSSGLHWDMVCDLRKNGEIYADGELIYRNGKFL